MEHFGVFAELRFHKSGDIRKNHPGGIKTDNYGNLLVAQYGMQAIQVLSFQGKVINFNITKFPLINTSALMGIILL